METLLAGLFDYAGLYPPAQLSLPLAANNYLQYRRGEHRHKLGRFIINLDRVQELRAIAGNSLDSFRLSVIAGEDDDWESVVSQIDCGVRIDAIEIKCADPLRIQRIANRLSTKLEIYFEVPADSDNSLALRAIRTAGARAKVRMGGVVREAIPAVTDTAERLKALAGLGLAFKATAGLHHPLRSTQPLSYEPQCPTGVMHGFVNLTGAVAVLYFGGILDEAKQVLSEEDPGVWEVNESSLRWRDRTWTTDQLAAVRQDFLLSIGSCSFEEPLQDLESLGWL